MSRAPAWISRLAREYAPLISSVEDERADGHGVWFYLKPGLQWSEGHQAHEETYASARDALDNVELCDCGECGKASAESIKFLERRR